jgi:uncharacterized delta-60 repeat protein
MKNNLQFVLIKHFLFPLLVLGSFQTVYSQCKVDPSFGINGQVEYSFSEDVRPVKMRYLEDGKIIIGGYIDYVSSWDEKIFFAKLLSDGSLDTLFGNNGMAFPFDSTTNNYLYDFMIKPDGKIIGVMTSGQNKIFQLNADGSPDTSFGFMGAKPVNSNWMLQLLPDGKVLSAGAYWNGSTQVISLNKLNTDGSPDTTFGLVGYTQTDLTNFTHEAPASMQIQPDNKIVLAGTAYNSAVELHFFIARFNSDGSPDNTFGEHGIVCYQGSDYFGRGELFDLAVLDNGKILACGYRDDASQNYGWYGLLICLNTDGSEDASFGDNGRVLIRQLYNSNSRFNALTVLDDGSILLAGTTTFYFQNALTGLSVHKISKGGIADTSFADHGIYFTNMFNTGSSNTTFPRDIIHSTTDVYICGATRNDSTSRFDLGVIKFNECGLLTKQPEVNSINIFPNPSDGHFKVTGLSGISSIRIINALGQIMYSKEFIVEPEYTVQLNVSNGIYLVEIISSDQQFTSKLIIHSAY